MEDTERGVLWQLSCLCSAAVVMRVKDRRNQRRAVDRMARDYHRNPIDLGETIWREDCFRRTAGHDCPMRQEGYAGGTEGSMIQIVQCHHHRHAVTLGEASDQG